MPSFFETMLGTTHQSKTETEARFHSYSRRVVNPLCVQRNPNWQTGSRLIQSIQKPMMVLRFIRNLAGMKLSKLPSETEMCKPNNNRAQVEKSYICIVDRHRTV